MKAVKIQIAEKELYLMYTGEAMFQLREKFGSTEKLFEATTQDTKEGFAALCEAVAILAEQGELVRRHLGYTPQKTLTVVDLRRIVMPTDIIALKTALPRVVALGYGREIEPENDEVDLGLAELNQKKTT